MYLYSLHGTNIIDYQKEKHHKHTSQRSLLLNDPIAYQWTATFSFSSSQIIEVNFITDYKWINNIRQTNIKKKIVEAN